MNLLQGIQLHELIMIILGFILGLTLIFIFLYTSLKSRPNLKILYGFVAPAFMIGYPSFKSTQFSNEVLKVEELVQQVNLNPADTVAQTALINQLKTLPASRCTSSVDAMTAIASAQASLGLYDSAKVMVQRAVLMDKESVKAQQTKKEIEEKLQMRDSVNKHINRIDEQIKLIEQKPANKLLRDTLAAQLHTVEDITQKNAVHLDNAHFLVLAKATYIAGQKEIATQLADEAIKVNPKQHEANDLKKDIQTQVIDKKYPPIKQRPRDNDSRRKPQNVPNTKSRIEAIPAPVPVYQDTTPLKFRVYPKVSELKKWDSKG